MLAACLAPQAQNREQADDCVSPGRGVGVPIRGGQFVRPRPEHLGDSAVVSHPGHCLRLYPVSTREPRGVVVELPMDDWLVMRDTVAEGA